MIRPLTAALASGLIFAAAAQAQPAPETKAEAQAEIWAKEQSIYRERGKGNLKPYIENVATDYKAWPPYSAVPTGVGNLTQTQAQMKVDNKELLAMEFVDFAMNGDAAVIYYRTHRTRLPNGQPADEHFEVTHSWVRQDGQWKVYGGMARIQPDRSAK